MKYLMMLVISLGLVGCGSDSKAPDNALEKWVEFENSRVGEYSCNTVWYKRQSSDRGILPSSKESIAKLTVDDIKGLKGKATGLTDNSYCSSIDDSAGDKKNVCTYIANADSSFFEEFYGDLLKEERVEINSVNSRSTFIVYPQAEEKSFLVRIKAMNPTTGSTTNEDGKLGERSIAGAWTFKTYIFNDNKLISLKSTISVNCTATGCTGVDLTDLIHHEIIDTFTNAKADFWSGSLVNKKAEVVISPDQKELSIMICKDFAKITSITECSFIAGTRVVEEAKE